MTRPSKIEAGKPATTPEGSVSKSEVLGTPVSGIGTHAPICGSPHYSHLRIMDSGRVSIVATPYPTASKQLHSCIIDND